MLPEGELRRRELVVMEINHTQGHEAIEDPPTRMPEPEYRLLRAVRAAGGRGEE